MSVENTEIEDEILDGKTAQDQINELKSLESRTPEQENELKRLKGQAAVDKRIAQYAAKTHQERERAERAERELQEFKAAQKPTEKKQALGQAETIQINGKEFYTDRGLVQLVNSGALTQDDAYAHQEERREERAVARVKQDMQTQTEAQIREEVKNKVLSEYPEFSPNHQNHNPNDPLFKEANRIWRNGYVSNPRGLELAIEDAKRILGRDHKRPDLAEEFGVTRNQEPVTRNQDKSKKIVLTDAEQELAWSYRRTMKNPKTGKTFTQAEAIEAAIKAKQDQASRQSRRV